LAEDVKINTHAHLLLPNPNPETPGGLEMRTIYVVLCGNYWAINKIFVILEAELFSDQYLWKGINDELAGEGLGFRHSPLN
jgi:hypothetical protein